jgi:hypothetical protein
MEKTGILILFIGVIFCGTSVATNVVYGLAIMGLGLGLIYSARKKEAKKPVIKPQSSRSVL